MGPDRPVSDQPNGRLDRPSDTDHPRLRGSGGYAPWDSNPQPAD